MNITDDFRKQVEDGWMKDFEGGTEFDDVICQDNLYHQKLDKINSPEDFWNFYLALKRDETLTFSSKKIDGVSAIKSYSVLHPLSW